MERIAEASPRQLARIAGALYMLNIVGGAFAIGIGYLVFRSTFLPRVSGVLLAIGASCYMAYGIADFLAPAFAAHLVPWIQLPSLAGEGSFCLWLMIAGLKVQGWKELAGAAGSRLEWAR